MKSPWSSVAKCGLILSGLILLAGAAALILAAAPVTLPVAIPVVAVGIAMGADAFVGLVSFGLFCKFKPPKLCLESDAKIMIGPEIPALR